MEMSVGQFYAYQAAAVKAERVRMSRMLMVVRAGVEGGEFYTGMLEALR